MVSLTLLGLTLALPWMTAWMAVTSSQEKEYRYLHLDVFTDRLLTGNQLAVFMDPEGLTTDEMQAIALEMNFSEVTFVFPPESDETDFRVRIFSTSREMNFAGHPTIGTAFALAREGLIGAGTERVVFELGIGPIPLELEWQGSQLTFAWMHQLAPTFGKVIADAAGVAAALGIEVEAILATRLPIQEVSCGSTFLFVPIVSRYAVDRAVLDQTALTEVFERAGIPRRGVFLFSTEAAGDDAQAYSRMLGTREDPATGSASGPLGSYLVHHKVVPEESGDRLISRQGVKMGRPSRIYMRIGKSGDEITEVRVGGRSVLVGEGRLRTP